MNEYFLAIDIGASSGRHILGWIENDKLCLEEIYRFNNGANKKNGCYVWDIDELSSNIIKGLIKAKETGKTPLSVGIDTWGVDYVLLDKHDMPIDNVYCYRDLRTLDAIPKVHEIVPFEELFQKTGASYKSFNTLYQLYADKLTGKLDKAESFLMIPDYFNFLLTGVKINEYTNATTTGLINIKTGEWDFSIIEKLGFPQRLFKNTIQSGRVIGGFSEEIQRIVGFNANVSLPCTHDTASAVVAVPCKSDSLYISSGTWSLIGVETDFPLTTAESLEHNYSNEGGFLGKIRYQKNIMGMWLIQCVRNEFDNKYSFSEIVENAESCSNFNSIIDVDDARFFAPQSMKKAISEYCTQTSQPVPSTIGEFAFCIYNSLAKAYTKAIEELEHQTAKVYPQINIVGGGSKNELLNTLTAKHSNKKIVSGPVEATAIGNIIVQLIANKRIENIQKAKELIQASFVG